MKRLSLLFMGMFAVAVMVVADDSIVELTPQKEQKLKIFEAMQENVVVNQTEDIDRLLQDKISGTEREEVQVQGYRVQVFSSNSQQTAKTAAFEVERQIKETDLEVESYVLYNPPFWKVRLGNFRTQQEAALLRDEIIKRFPQMQGDTYVVRDQITVLQ